MTEPGDDFDPMAGLSWWDRLMVRRSIWWSGLWEFYCPACDVSYTRRERREHRSCRCGFSRPDTWTDGDREAFTTVVEAAAHRLGYDLRFEEKQ